MSMDAVGSGFVAGLCVAILIFLLTLFLLWRVPASLSRNLAVVLITLLMIASVLTVLVTVGIPGRYELFVIALSDMLTYWSVAVELRMILSFSKWREASFTGVGRFILYLPVAFTSLMLTVAGAQVPSTMRVYHLMGPPFATFGFMDPVIMVAGVVYILSAIIALSLMLRTRVAQIRMELLMLLAILVTGIGASLGALFILPELSTSAVYLVIGFLLGLTLSRMALKKSLLIIPQKEERTVEREVDPLAPGATYIFLQDKEQARELFTLYLKNGKEGLWVTRRPPQEVRDIYGLKKTPFIWLTSAPVTGENCVDPAEFGQLSSAFFGFIRNAKDYIIFIEGIEYIVSKNSFPTVLKLVQYLNDRVMSTGGILMLWMDPHAFEARDIALLKSEAAEVFEEAVLPVHARRALSNPKGETFYNVGSNG
jgi:hypothetical protein